MIIGLTGGIASGKSTAANLLGAWGAYVIDADKLGHRAYEKGSPAFSQVVSAFGSETIGADGEIDRRVLGSKVFGDANALKSLTDIVWPSIHAMAKAEIIEAIAADPARPVVVEAAVLIEAQWQDLVDQIWVTVIDREVAIARACARDGANREQIEARIDSQLDNAQRCEQADQVIDNSGSEGDLKAQLLKLWQALDASDVGQST